MVDIATVDEARLAQIMGKKPEETVDLYDWIPPTMRLEIPLRDANSLARISEILNDLAIRLTRISANHQVNQGSRRAEAFSEIRAAQLRLKDYTKSGRAGR